MSCLYKILGVTKSASKKEIKQAYLKLVVQFHPDKHTNSPPQTKAAALEKFKQISNAYTILFDDRARAAYDLKQTESPQHKRQGHHNAGQSRQSDNHTKSSSSAGGAQTSQRRTHPESPYAAQTRRSINLKLQAAAALKFLRHVCVEFMKFTVEIVVRAVIKVVLRMILEIILDCIIAILKALLQPSSKKKVKSKDEWKKK